MTGTLRLIWSRSSVTAGSVAHALSEWAVFEGFEISSVEVFVA